MVACVDDIPAEIGATTEPPVPFPLPPQFTAPFTETFYSEVGPIFGCLAFRSDPLTPIWFLESPDINQTPFFLVLVLCVGEQDGV